MQKIINSPLEMKVITNKKNFYIAINDFFNIKHN